MSRYYSSSFRNNICVISQDTIIEYQKERFKLIYRILNNMENKINNEISLFKIIYKFIIFKLSVASF